MSTNDQDVLKMFLMSANALRTAVQRPPEVQYLRITEELVVNDYGSEQTYPVGTYITLSEGSVYPSYYTPEQFEKQYTTQEETK